MDKVPVLKAKLVAPEIPGRVLFSERIKNLNMPGYRAVVITAPAGFGKTTAVLLSLGSERNNMRWYRMEREDSFLPVFYAHVIEAIFGWERKDTTDSARSLASIGKISEEYSLLNAVICQDAWAQYAGDESPAYLIFDDFQNVAGNAAIVETVRYFISNLPPCLRIIIMSRVDTGIGPGKLALNEDILLIDEQALRFSKEEIAELSSDVYHIEVESRGIQTMLDYSEGWIAGITMLLHAAGSSFHNFEKLLTQGSRKNVFRYLLTEAFDAADGDMLKTLASISIMPEFTCDDLKAVFSMKNAAETILWLEKNNIYIQKTKMGAVVYRFHSLFRNALLSVLEDLFTPEEIRSMNLAAARHYKSLGNFSAAIRLLLAAAKTEEAVAIASKEGLRLINTGDTDKANTLIQAFSEELIRNNAYLLLLRGASLMNTELDESYSCLSQALTLSLRGRDSNLQMRTAGLMVSICFQNNTQQNIGSIIALLPKSRMMVTSRYARLTLLKSAFMKAVWSDKLDLGKKLYKIIDRFEVSEPLWDYTYKLAKGILFYRSGDLRAAEVILHQILTHPAAQVNDRWKAMGMAMCHCITSLMGNAAASRSMAEELTAIGEKYNSDYAYAYAFRLAAYNKYLLGDISRAVLEIEKSEHAFSRYQNPVMVSASRMTQYLWRSEYESAEALAVKALAELRHLESLNPGLGFIELSQANVGAICKEAGRYAEAENFLLQSYKESLKKKAIQSMCGAAMHLADLYYRTNNNDFENKYLKVWAKATVAEGYLYFREMNYPAMVRVCARCIEKKIGSDYMLRIIGKYFNADNAARIAEAPAEAAANPKAFISGCFPSLQKKKPVKVKLLGSFRLVADNIEIGESEWKTRKICGILKYILANPKKLFPEKL